MPAADFEKNRLNVGISFSCVEDVGFTGIVRNHHPVAPKVSFGTARLAVKLWDGLYGKRRILSQLLTQRLQVFVFISADQREEFICDDILSTSHFEFPLGYKLPSK